MPETLAGRRPRRLQHLRACLGAPAAAAPRRCSAGAAAAAADDEAMRSQLRAFMEDGVKWDEPVPRLEVGSDAAKEHLAEHGFVVIRDVRGLLDCVPRGAGWGEVA